MNNLLRLRLLHLLILISIALPTSAQLVVFNRTASALPGQALSLQGNFSATAKAFMLVGNATTPTPLPILLQSPNHLAARIPPQTSPDLYQVWVEDQAQRSPPVYINQALAHHPDCPTISPGGPLRIFGRNLRLGNATPQVRLTANGTTLEATVNLSLSDAYKLTLVMPAGLQPGTTYSLLVSNGAGGANAQTRLAQTLTAVPAGGDYFGLGVGWAARLNFTGNVYNVKTDSRLSLKAVGDGNTNDQPAIQAAIDRAAADGGGIVYLPAGNYKLSHYYFEYLHMRSRVVVQGAGKDQTLLRYGYQLESSHMAVLFAPATSLSGLADLSLLNIDNSGSPAMGNLRANQVSQVFMQRVRLDLNRGDWMELSNTDQLVLANSDFTQGVNNNSNYRGPINMNASTNFVLSRNNITFAVYGLNFDYTHEGVFEQNRVYRDGAARYPANLLNHVLILNFTENIAVLGNLFKVINGPAQNANDGETIIAEGGGTDRIDEESGTASGATATTLVDNSKNWGSFRRKPIVAIVSGTGMGQWRSITSRSGTTLNLDRGWDVVPGAGSNYAIFNWGARNWLLQGNTLEGNRRGITLYHNATNEVAVVGNTLTNSGSIDFTPLQQNTGRQQFIPIFNNQIIGNNVSNTDRTNGVFIGVHPVQHVQTRTFGTSVIGLEMRGNSLTAGQPNVPAVVDANYPEGYLNYLEYHQMTVYQDERIPAVLGTIFESNRANNAANGLYLNSGSYNTVVCDLQLVNSGGMKDSPLDNISHGAVNTGGCTPLIQPISAPAQTVSLSWVTSPAGLQVSLNGQVRTTPYSQTFVVGTAVSLSVPTPQSMNGVTYAFSNWSLGLGTSLTVPSANATYTANFTTSASPSTSPVISGSLYTIIAKHSGKALDLYNGAKDDGGKIVQWTLNGGDNQKWLLTNLNNGYYSIKAFSSGKALDVYGASGNDGAKVLQWTPSNQDNQQFKLVDAGGGYFNIVARHSGKVLDIDGNSQADGAPLQQWSNSGGDNQKFRFTRLSGGRLGALDPADELDPAVKVYPNPAVSVVRVVGTGGGAVQVVDLTGRLQASQLSEGDEARVDVSALSPGVYLVQFLRGERLISRKLIVNH